VSSGSSRARATSATSSPEQEKIAELEASLKATIDGEEIPYRKPPPGDRDSEERDRRERLERVRNELTEEHLNPLYLRSTQVVHRETERLGARTTPSSTAA